MDLSYTETQDMLRDTLARMPGVDVGSVDRALAQVAGLWIVRDNNEGNSGGPFYRSLLNQGTGLLALVGAGLLLGAATLVKAQTLGASTWLTAIRVALPQAMPRLIDSLRFNLCPAWVYLISAEAIAADVGLGYRIFLVRRYLAMDIILPYVAWISLLAVAMDLLLTLVSRRAFPWAHAVGGRR